jgi:hypothetical protein
MRLYRCGALALVVAACCLASVSSVFAAPHGAPAASMEGKLSGKFSSRTVRIGMDEATQTARDPSAFSLAAPLAMLLGTGVIGYRVYSRRQGRPAT